MKKILLKLAIIIFYCGISQDITKTEAFKNGQIKSEEIYENGVLKISKSYYKNGQLKHQQYVDNGIWEEYFKNGELHYKIIHDDKIRLEEVYNRNGQLIIRTINDTIDFSAYDNASEILHELQHKKNNHHDHGHSHGHHHGHSH